MAGIATRCDATVAELGSRERVGTSPPAKWNEYARQIGMTGFASPIRGGWDVRRHQAVHGLRRNTKEGAIDNIVSMACRTCASEPSMTESGICELGVVLHRQRQAGVGAHVATLAAQASHWNVGVGRRHNGRRHVGHCVERRIGRAVALRAIDRARGRIGVNVRYRRHHRQVRICVACRAGRTRLERNMVCWRGAGREVVQTGMAVGAFTRIGVRGIGYVESSSRNLRTCLEALEWCLGCDRVLTHAHPDLVGVVA